jgi:imidazolonepropionase-like amidohydrolase
MYNQILFDSIFLFIFEANMKKKLTLILLLLSTQVLSQYRPQNGVSKSQPQSILIINAKIYKGGKAILESGSILIENDKVVSVGRTIKASEHTLVFDMEGRTILPSFIELNSSVGIAPQILKKGKKYTPQTNSLKQNSFYWNQAVHPELNASDVYNPDIKVLRKLNNLGIGYCLTRSDDGLIQGTAALVATHGNDLSKDILEAKAAAFYSFSKGSSMQSYPSSQMGSIALLRQSFYDLNYYSNSSPDFTDLSMEAWEQQSSLPRFFISKDKLEILRAVKIAKEFDSEFIYVGSGNEYEALEALSESNVKVVLPINFPKAYDVSDPYISRLIPLSDLKHWELAPFNFKKLLDRGIRVSITTAGLKDAKHLWSNIRTLLSTGVSKFDVLQALTSEPANILGKKDQIGMLKSGMLASFTVYDLDPFENEKAKINEIWIHGAQQHLNTFNGIELAGAYDINIDGFRRKVTLSGNTNKPLCKAYELDKEFKPIDSTKCKCDFQVNGNDINVKLIDKRNSSAYILKGKISGNGSIIEGDATLPDGSWKKWSALKVAEKDVDKPKISSDTVYVGKCWFPNMAFGSDSLSKASKFLFRNATVWTNEADGILEETDVLVENGKIIKIGKIEKNKIADEQIIDATGKHLTSGIIDEHSHIAISKGVNEGGQAISAEVSIGDVVNSEDINIYRQLSGGVTCAQLLHGSANPIGGQSALVKLKWGASPEEMLINGAPGFIKFALGENVKQSNWGAFNTVRFPQTRMGVEQVFYDGFHRARIYKDEWSAFEKKTNTKKVKAPRFDLELETLAEILDSKRFITCHSYVQSEINMLMHVADSMGFKVNTFTHILEGYKVADKMKAHGVGGSTFSDWWAYKYEVNDAIPYNAALMSSQGVTVAINSDDAEMGRRLNQEAAKSVKYGGLSQEEAWKLVTLNPAKLLHLDDKMGSIKVGKDADLVLWTDNPLSILAKVQKTMIEGQLYYDADQNDVLADRNRMERARIIQKMALDNTSGNPMRQYQHSKERFFHCDSHGEEGETKTNLH